MTRVLPCGNHHDTIPENLENFFLDLAPPPGEALEQVTITPSQATVTIEDDECEFSSDMPTPHNVLTLSMVHTTWTFTPLRALLVMKTFADEENSLRIADHFTFM